MGNQLVLELQRLAQSSTTNIGDLLRLAKVVVVKLDLQDAQAWIDHEIEGYSPSAIVPPYRIIPSELEVMNPFHGWNAVGWEEGGQLQEHFSTIEVRMTIAEVEAAAKIKRPGFGLNQAETNALVAANETWGRLPARKMVSQVSLIGIIESVRAKVLNWSLALEKRGILGEGMTFNDNEKLEATKVPLQLDGFATNVLFLSANPISESPLDVDKEQSRIVKVRNGSKFQSKIRIEGLPNLDLPEFAKSLRLHKPNVVHFSGHGSSDGALVMRDENGQGTKMAPKGLARLLAQQKSTIQLIVLNACYSSKLADLLISDIDCVVGMNDSVSDDAAILFAQAFYSAIFDGDSIGDAFDTSAASIEARYGDEKDIPLLRTKVGADAYRIKLVN